MELKKGRNANSGVDYYSVSKTLSKYVKNALTNNVRKQNNKNGKKKIINIK